MDNAREYFRKYGYIEASVKKQKKMFRGTTTGN